VTGICICIGKDCTAKNTLGVPGLADKVFQSKEVEALASEWAVKDPTKTAEQIFMTTTWRDRDGEVHERQMSVSEARMQFYDLQNFLGECSTCQANISSDRFKGGVFSGFGCIVHIDYPISAILEYALMVGAQRVTHYSKAEPSVAFIERISKEKLTGDPIAKLRSTNPPNIESTEPQSITYGGFISKKTITTDQILEMMLKPSVSPDDALVYHHFLENTHTALQEAGGDVDIREFITTLSALFASAAQMQRPINVHM
jgi:hypothetical protein